MYLLANLLYILACLLHASFFFFYIVGLHKFGNPWFLYHIKKGIVTNEKY